MRRTRHEPGSQLPGVPAAAPWHGPCALQLVDAGRTPGRALAPYSDAPIQGWLSPARSQSENTPELLQQAGLQWFGDWINDELPYPFQTANGPLTALPLSLELEDRFIVGENLHAEAEYADQMVDACDFLLEEAQRSGQGRLLALNIHPWVMGQPHRIKHLERVFAHLADNAGLIWNAAPSQIIAASR